MKVSVAGIISPLSGASAPRHQTSAINLYEPATQEAETLFKKGKAMTMNASGLRQPALRRLAAFSCVLRPLCVLAIAASLARVQFPPAIASEAAPTSVAAFDIVKVGEDEIIPGIGIKLSELGELAPLALDLLARGIPPIGILKDIFKAGMDLKAKIEAKAQRAEDVARMKALATLLSKVSIAMVEESERQVVRFELLRADNRKTHEELLEAKRQRDELKSLLAKAAASNDAIAIAIKQLRVKSPQSKAFAKSKALLPPPNSQVSTFLGIPITKRPDWGPDSNGP